MVARCSHDWEEAAGVTAQANAIGERAVDLAHTDGRAWEDALAAVRGAETARADDPRRDFALEQKLEAAAAAPLEIASLGADVAALAALAGHHCDATYRADAEVHANQVRGSGRSSGGESCGSCGVRAADKRLARALASEQAAHDVAERMLESTR